MNRSSDRNFEQEVGAVGGEDQKPSTVPCKRTQSTKRAKKKGGETSAPFLNWSHRDPQGSPHRTCRKVIKICRCGSKKKKWVGEKKGNEETVSVGEEEPVGTDQEKSRLILPFAARQDLVPMRGSKTGGCLGLSAIKPMIHVQWCTQPFKQSVYLCSAKVLAACGLDRFALA